MLSLHTASSANPLPLRLAAQRCTSLATRRAQGLVCTAALPASLSSLAYVPLHTLHLAGASPGADAAAQAAPLPVPVEQLALAGSDAATHVGLHIDGGALVVVLLLGAALLALSGKSLAGLSLLTQRAQPGGQAASHEHRLHMEPSALDLLFSQDDITDTEDEGRGSGFTQKGYYKPSLRRH